MYLEIRGFVIFLQGPTFWDFFDTGPLNYIPSGIQICFPLFWGIFFVIGPFPIKQWGPKPRHFFLYFSASRVPC